MSRSSKPPRAEALRRVHIVGRGAVGVLLAARLSEAGCTVYFYGQDQENEVCLRIEAEGRIKEVKVLGRLSYGRYQPGPGDLVVMACKWPGLVTEMKGVHYCWGDDLHYLFPQNGMLEPRPGLESPPRSAWSVIVRASVERVLPNVIKVFSVTDFTVSNRLCRNDPVARDALSRAGFRFLPRRDFLAAQAEKLLVASMGSLMALVGMTIGEALKNKVLCLWLGRLVDEGYSILSARMLSPLSAEEKKGLASLASGIRTGSFLAEAGLMDAYTSLHHDLARRVGSTEARWINGLIVAEAEALGKDAPLNALLLELVERVSKEQRVPGELAADELIQKSLAQAFSGPGVREMVNAL